MLDNPFTSNILSELIAGLILLIVPSVAAVLWLFFGTLERGLGETFSHYF
jgi:hypothetical protein